MASSVVAQDIYVGGARKSFGGFDAQDVPLKARSPRGEELTALELLQEALDAHARHAGKFEARALRNELYFHGDQFRDVNETTLEVEDLNWLSDVPQVYRNYLRPLINTYSARILKDRQDAVAYANDISAKDSGAVDVANQLIYHCHAVNDIDDAMFTAATHAQCHGMVAFVPRWDPTKGPPSAGVWELDENGDLVMTAEPGEPLGEVELEVRTLFDFGLDGSEKIEDSNYVWFREHIQRDEAALLLQDAGIDEEPEVVNYVDLFEGEQEGVEVYEFWHLPTPRIPEGCRFLVMGGHVVEYDEVYPYDHGELPIAVWKLAPRRRTGYGSSHVDDAVVIQRQINELVSVIHKLTRDTGDLRFIGHPAVIDSIEAGNHTIAIADPKQRENNGWMDPPDPPPLLFAQLESLIKVLYDVFGLNEILTGQENVRSGTSARQISYLEQLDSMKLSGAARNLWKAQKRFWRQILKLYQQYVEDDRLIQIVGEDGEVDVMAFRGSELDGVDVRLEPRSGHERTRGAEAARAEEEMAAGLIPPDEGLERRRSGMPETLATGHGKMLVQRQIIAALEGAPSQPTQLVDPILAVKEITEAVDTVAPYARQINLRPLEQLLMGYQQLAAQRMQMMGAPQPQPPGGGGPKPGGGGRPGAPPQNNDKMEMAAL